MRQAVPEQIWQDNCYYFDSVTGECMRKYVLVLAVDLVSGDSVTAVFTSTPNGLRVDPPCNQGDPRSGYYVGLPGGRLNKETWVDFNSLQTLDDADLARHVSQRRTILLSLNLPRPVFCSVLRCLLGSDDLERRHARLIGDLAAVLSCP